MVDLTAIKKSEVGMSFRAGKGLYRSVKSLAKKENVSMSMFIKLAVAEKVAKQKGKAS